MSSSRLWRSSVLMSVLLVSPISQASFFGLFGNDNRPDAAPAILAAFQGSCGSQGVFTQAANNQSQAIINVIETLKNTDACKPFISQLSTIQSAASSMLALQNTSSYSTYQADQQNYQLLTLALQNSTPGSTEQQGIQSAIDTLRLQMYTDEAAYNVSSQTTTHNLRVTELASMMSWAQQLTTTSTSPSLAACLQQSPAAALELGTNFLAYGGSLLPGIYGAGVAAAGQLVTSAFETLRQGQYDSTVFETQSNQMPDSLNCAFESLSDSYCSDDDSYSLLELAKQNRLPDYSLSPLWKGIDILSRQMPVLLNWLAQIQNEVPPQDAYQASKQASVLQEIFEVQQQNLNSVATINNALDQANSASTPDAKSTAIVNAVAELALVLITPSTTATGPNSFVTLPTPFSIYGSDPFAWACWLVLGPNATCPAVPPQDINPNGPPQTSQLTDYVRNTLGLGNPAQLILTEGALLTNWQNLLPNVQVLVNADFARIIATNAGVILASARVATNGSAHSPYQVLQNISGFLQAMILYPSDNPQLPLALQQEKQKVDETIRQLTAADSEVCPPISTPVQPGHPLPPSVLPVLGDVPVTPAECQTQRLVTIFNLFQLQNGTQVFLTDMNGLVSIDLQNRFVNGEIGGPAATILKASGQDLSLALQSAGIGDFDPIADDLDNARADIEENIQVFRQFFVNGFQDAVKHEAVYVGQESTADGANRPHGQKLGQLCLFWLLTGNIPSSNNGTDTSWPDDSTRDVCRKAMYFNDNISPASGTAPVPAFDVGQLEQSLGNAPFSKRVCLFHKYKLQNKADTRYGIGNNTQVTH